MIVQNANKSTIFHQSRERKKKKNHVCAIFLRDLLAFNFMVLSSQATKIGRQGKQSADLSKDKR